MTHSKASIFSLKAAREENALKKIHIANLLHTDWSIVLKTSLIALPQGKFVFLKQNLL